MQQQTTPRLTPEERERLTSAMRKAAEGIAEAWIAINSIAARTSFDWMPRDTSIGEIAGTLGAEIDTPAYAAKISAAEVMRLFSKEENWSRPWMVKK